MSPHDTVHGRFDELVGELDYPMFIVTTGSESGERAGCLVGFATQCSIDPPRFLVCVSKANRTYRVGRAASALGVHLVPSSAAALAELFGGRTGDEEDNFDRCEWRAGPGGVPILVECRNWLVGRVRERVDLGDHVGFVLDPIEVLRESGQDELTFHRARRIDSGHKA